MTPGWTRRGFVLSLASAAGLGGSRLAFAGEETRTLELFNTHTSETVQCVYWRAGRYLEAGLETLRRVLRDHRSGKAHDIDPALYDQLHVLARAARRDARFDIISGYRSPESNAKLAAAGNGVAKQSLHMQGRALDIRLRGYSTAALRDLAIEAQRGGVGYYKRSDFVHVDTGRFRTWSG